MVEEPSASFIFGNEHCFKDKDKQTWLLYIRVKDYPKNSNIMKWHFYYADHCLLVIKDRSPSLSGSADHLSVLNGVQADCAL